MNTKGFIRSAAASIATAGILGGGALGFAAGANASTAAPEQMTQQHMAAEWFAKLAVIKLAHVPYRVG